MSKQEIIQYIQDSYGADEGSADNIAILYQKKNSKDKPYAWHAPEVKCIAKGKAAKPYEIGCKVSVSTNVNSATGGHFILEARAVHGTPHDSKTLKEAIKSIENNTGIEIERIYVNKGYQGHNCERKHRVCKSGQKRGVFGQNPSLDI